MPVAFSAMPTLNTLPEPVWRTVAETPLKEQVLFASLATLKSRATVNVELEKVAEVFLYMRMY